MDTGFLESQLDSKKLVWLGVTLGAGALAALLVRKGIEHGWRAAMDAEPPDDPTSLDIDWRDAILWTLASGVVVSMGRLLAIRGAAVGLQRFAGESPPR